MIITKILTNNDFLRYCRILKSVQYLKKELSINIITSPILRYYKRICILQKTNGDCWIWNRVDGWQLM